MIRQDHSLGERVEIYNPPSSPTYLTFDNGEIYMVKLCKVIKNNPATIVIKFDAVEVQMPAIGRDAKEIWVAYENGKYFAVDKKYADDVRKCEEAAAQARKRVIKKTTEKDELASEKEDVQDEAE